MWEKPVITTPEQFVGSSNVPQRPASTWRVRFARPEGTSMEDFYVELQGIPPFLSSTPEDSAEAGRLIPRFGNHMLSCRHRRLP